jgi:hypothetical protein
VDVATQSYVRVQKTPGINNDHDATLFINNPRAGYLYRPAGTALAANGSTVTINAFTGLGMRGTGVTPLHLFVANGQKWFDLSVLQP